MKTFKLLAMCFVVCCLFTGNLYAQGCSSGLLDILGPNGNTYTPGETICYSVDVQIPDDPGFCTYENFQVYFFAPDNPPDTGDACTATNGVLIIDEATFGPGDDISEDCISNPSALEYTTSPDDVVNVDELVAYICTKFTLDDNPDSDSKTITNYLIQPDFSVFKECVNPEGTLVGDPAEFRIVITNTGDVPLDFIINDANAVPAIVDEGVGSIVPDANYTTTITIPTDGECEDDQLVSNEVIVDGFVSGETVAFDQKSFTAECPVLCYPDFTVEKECVSAEPIVDELEALFDITITNTGKVPLDFVVTDATGNIIGMVFEDVAPDDVRVIEDVNVPADCVEGAISNEVEVTAYYADGSEIPAILLAYNPKTAEAECSCGSEGCTPGYWKNSPGCWCGDYVAEGTEATKLCEVFDLPCDDGVGKPTTWEKLGEATMMEALSFRGGRSKVAKTRILLRHATAAVLNACNENINYPGGDVDAVVDIVDEILQNWGSRTARQILKQAREFDEWNNSGCPISADNAPEGVRCERHDEEIDGEVI
jgi:hypothetical protein